MVPIHSNGDPKRPKGISKAIEEYTLAHSEIPTNRWLEHIAAKRAERNEG